MSLKVTFKALTPETWPFFEKLFGPKGACGGCWCMTWRLQRSDYERLKGDGNKKAIQKLVKKNEPIGMLAFVGEDPAGWCAVAPREKYIRLETSRGLKPIDHQSVWSVSCFFIAKPYRRKGLSVKLLKATLDYAKKEGAIIVEAYPVEPKDKKMPDVFAWTGILSSFLAAGFKEEKRHSVSRPIVRYYLEGNGK
jgi:GNAT superfamily N-acetyltransferase